jgi:hypothetical protein
MPGTDRAVTGSRPGEPASSGARLTAGDNPVQPGPRHGRRSNSPSSGSQLTSARPSATLGRSTSARPSESQPRSASQCSTDVVQTSKTRRPARVLGSVELDKVLVKVVRVDEHLAVARTFRTYTVGGGGISAFDALQGTPERVVTEPLRTNERLLKDELDERSRTSRLVIPSSKSLEKNTMTATASESYRPHPGIPVLVPPLARSVGLGAKVLAVTRIGY